MDLTPEPVAGGGPFNAAIAAARLGASAAFLGRISTDDFGHRLLEHLVANDVDTTLVERGDEPTATAEVDPGPPLRFTFRGAGTADTALGDAPLESLPTRARILHGGTLGLFRGRTAETLATAVERFDGLVSLDPNIRPQLVDDRARWDHFHDRWLAHCDVYKGSDEDLEWIFPGRGHESIAAELIAGGCSIVAVTTGPDGALLYTGDEAVRVPGRMVEVVDTVGAGDTFIGSLLASLWDRAQADTAWRPSALAPAEISAIGGRAVAAAAMACTRAGADPPTRAELDAFVAIS